MTKTWVEMYGCPDNCVVDGEYISHKTGNSYKVVCRLDSEKQAHECLTVWQKEWEGRKLPTTSSALSPGGHA